MQLSKSRIVTFQSFIFQWWKSHRRDLPWRRTYDPYRIMISEIMLQQTQVSRVIPKYEEFLVAFPMVDVLAQAPVSDILRAWKGMGYNRRALYLKQAAQAIVEGYGGKFPKSEIELIKLPGMGKYTVRAVLVFAYKQQIAMVDTNIRKIITHFFFDDLPQKEKIIETIAEQLVPKGKAWEWHQALMDYGAIEMTSIKLRVTNKAKKIKPFKETNRFFRGRVVDRLREGTVKEVTLLGEFSKQYEKPSEFLISLLDGLEHDGLISRSKTGIISLPE